MVNVKKSSSLRELRTYIIEIHSGNPGGDIEACLALNADRLQRNRVA
jgi:hypothetical protein